MTAVIPQPGDLAAVSTGGAGGRLIHFAEWLNKDGSTKWEHVFIYTGNGKIVQAEPSGAEEVPLGRYGDIIWSTGILFPTETQRIGIVRAAHGYAAARIGYSWLDYAAIAAHTYHVPVPGLKEYIGDTGHMQCAFLGDRCWWDGSYHLFDDNRWPGYVTPYDIGHLLETKKVAAQA